MIPFSLSCPEANITLKLDVNYYGKIRVNCAVYSQKIPQKCRKMQAVLPLAGVDPLICNHLHDALYASILKKKNSAPIFYCKFYTHILQQSNLPNLSDSPSILLLQTRLWMRTWY